MVLRVRHEGLVSHGVDTGVDVGATPGLQSLLNGVTSVHVDGDRPELGHFLQQLRNAIDRKHLGGAAKENAQRRQLPDRPGSKDGHGAARAYACKLGRLISRGENVSQHDEAVLVPVAWRELQTVELAMRDPVYSACPPTYRPPCHIAVMPPPTPAGFVLRQ